MLRETKYDKLGRVRQYPQMQHEVQCTNCGATGPTAWYYFHTTTDPIPEEAVVGNRVAAATQWNARGPTNHKVFDLVDRLFALALAESKK